MEKRVWSKNHAELFSMNVKWNYKFCPFQELNYLKNEVEQFQLQRAVELEKIEKFREEEMQKLRYSFLA